VPLKDISKDLKTNYNSRIDNIVQDLYIPCFKNSSLYYRGTAYFRSSVLDLYKKEILNFCKKGGKIAILTSTEVMSEDAKNILQGYTLRDFEKTLGSMINDEETSYATQFICALIASNHLDVYVVKGPLYHDKVGFFEDENNDVVAFTGSGNETIPGVSTGRNFERYTVNWSERNDFPSYGLQWSEELRTAIEKGEYADAEILRFDKLSDFFMNKYDISSTIEDYQFESRHKFNYFDYDKLSPNGPQKHQIRAFEGWSANERFALFEHATGTYKTASGLMCADDYLGLNNYVVISTPRIIISENWSRLIEKCFDKEINIIRCWGDNKNWHTNASDIVNSSQKCIFVFVNDSLWSDQGLDFLKILRKDFLLIADETHRWQDARSKDFMDQITPNARLALTAKLSEPELESEMVHILNFFASNQKSEVFTDYLDLGYAINEGFLRKYTYELIVIEPIEIIESHSLSEIVSSIWKDYKSQKRNIAPSIAIERLETYNRVLAYTGPEIRDAVDMFEEMQLVWLRRNNMPGLFKKVTGQETPTQRAKTIKEFTLGLVRSLVAIKVLDEGVSLPISDVALMTISNESYRQWIQRRGRVLRKENVDDISEAKVVDFILDLSKLELSISNAIKDKYHSEIQRIIEFSNLSKEGSQQSIDKLMICGWL
jgi:superfamily II DNA or RNA helicase